MFLAAILPGSCGPAPGDLVMTAEANGLDAFAAASRTAGLDDTLAGPGPFTVIAPTDAAWTALPAGLRARLDRPAGRTELRAVLFHHIVPGAYDSARLASEGGEMFAADGLALQAQPGPPMTIDGAVVVAGDIRARNGVIHAVDRVLLPPRPPAP